MQRVRLGLALTERSMALTHEGRIRSIKHDYVRSY